ncbi:MAG: hypothetical protein JST86_09600 [Bacteroidetes bacterium]|nr:hypothetical protein [Bacteroidota bacterium]
MAYTATLKKLSENLKTTYENTIFQHSGNKGDTREKEVIDYLSKVMAHKYGFQSGEVFDKNDINSGQIDVIMYDNLFSTVFTDGSGKIVAPVESTYGIISVKSKMGTRELDNAIAGIQSYNALVRPASKNNTLQIMPDFGISLTGSLTINKSTKQENINCIFAFDTTIATETIIQKIKNSNCVDLLVVPGKFCVIGRQRSEIGLANESGKVEFAAINNENSVGLFVLFLQIYLSLNKLIARDIQNLVLELIHGSTITTLS